MPRTSNPEVWIYNDHEHTITDGDAIVARLPHHNNRIAAGMDIALIEMAPNMLRMIKLIERRLSELPFHEQTRIGKHELVEMICAIEGSAVIYSRGLRTNLAAAGQTNPQKEEA